MPKGVKKQHDRGGGQALRRHREQIDKAARDVIERYKGTLERIEELRALVGEIDSAMEWFRSKEPLMLDNLRVKMLQQFTDDAERRWSTTDYAILVDKARLMRGESSVNLSSLMGVVLKAEEIERGRYGCSGGR